MINGALRTGMCVLFLVPVAIAFAQIQSSFDVPNGVEVTRDIVYARYGKRALRLDLYRPKVRPAKSLAGVVVVRGGGYGDKEGFGTIAAELAQHGLAAASIEYRVLPEAGVMDSIRDCKAAVRWMRAEGEKHGIRPDRLGAMGASAGGHLVALLGTSHEAAELEGNGGHPNVSSRVTAVVAMAPVIDIRSYVAARQTRPRPYTEYFQKNPLMFVKLSPLTYLDKGSAPMLLIHSRVDQSLDYSQSLLMEQQCRKAGISVELMTIEDAPHPFWNLPMWREPTIQRSVEFFHSVLGR